MTLTLTPTAARPLTLTPFQAVRLTKELRDKGLIAPDVTCRTPMSIGGAI